MKIRREAREKLIEKGMTWKQVYTEKTEFLKEQFEAVIGPGSYFRFEGKSRAGDNYYCIIGPAKVHAPRAKWFAGVRKLPATYSAGGKYFDSLDAAAKYAAETWGVPIPSELKPYTSAQLYGIKEKIDKWKDEHEKEQEKKKDKEEKREKKKKERKKRMEERKEDSGKIEKGSSKLFNLAEHKLVEAMAKWQVYRAQYIWWDYEELEQYKDVDPSQIEDPEVAKRIRRWQKISNQDPSVQNVFADAQDFRGKDKEDNPAKKYPVGIYNKLRRLYGMSDEEIEQVAKTYIGYDPHYGGFICSVGPYAPKESFDALAKNQTPKHNFSFYTLPITRTDMDSVVNSLSNAYKFFKDEYPDIDFKTEDFSATIKGLGGSTMVGSNPMEDLNLSSLEWKVKVPTSDELYKKYVSMARRLKGQGQTDEEIVNNIVSNFVMIYDADELVQKYFPQYPDGDSFIRDELSKKTQIRDRAYIETISQINTDRTEENKTLNPEGYALDQAGAMSRTGSNIGLSPSGKYKVFQSEMEKRGALPYLEQAIQAVAAKNNRQYKADYGGNPEAVREKLEGMDMNTMKRVYRELNKNFSASQGSEKALLPPIYNLPINKTVFTSGAQTFSALKQDSTITREMELRVDILKNMLPDKDGKMPTLKEIWNRINADPKRQWAKSQAEAGSETMQAEHKVYMSHIKDVINELRAEAMKLQMDQRGLLSEMEDRLERYRSKSGFDDMDTAEYIANLKFTQTRVDYATGAKMNVGLANMAFQSVVQRNKNWTVDQLMAKFENRNQPIPETEEEAEQDLSVPEIPEVEAPEEEPVDETVVVEEMQKDPVDPVQPEPVTDNTLVDETEVDNNSTKKEDISSSVKKNDNRQIEASIRTVFTKTIQDLSKMAHELDADGKTGHAEDIYRVIRRYKGRTG